jgi:hypothetical protein
MRFRIHDEAEKARSECAALKSTRLQQEWNQAIETFRGLLDQDIEAHLHEYSTGQKTWSLFGSSKPDLRACRTACELAGHSLGVSKTGRTLPSEIANEGDYFARWLSFVAMKDGFHGTGGSGQDNTGPVVVTWTSKSIGDIALASKRLCEDCLSREAFL